MFKHLPNDTKKQSGLSANTLLEARHLTHGSGLGLATLHHIALNVALEDFEFERLRLEGLGLKVHATEHAWLHVHSLYFADPEGNTLEFVAYDGSVG